MRFHIWTVAVALSVIATQVKAQEKEREKKLKHSDLPTAVRKTADEQSKGATVVGYSQETENGTVEYEVAMTKNGHNRDVSIAADGSILEIEEAVALDSLPAAVRDGLRQLAGSGKITKVESITKKDAVVAYEAHVSTNGKKSEIQVGPDGKPLAHPE
ncbi:MAG TPA: hypothetical protein VG454_07305 [Gemmatimonadales bacterium]|nr:hypothetical protein [Gemmatimonadales bacterium]